VKLWDAATGRELLTLQGLPGISSLHHLGFSADGNRLYLAGPTTASEAEIEVKVWNATPLVEGSPEAGTVCPPACRHSPMLTVAVEQGVSKISGLPAAHLVHLREAEPHSGTASVIDPKLAPPLDRLKERRQDP
jgi:hypothetical protein